MENRPADLPAFLDEVRDFAYEEYAPALLKSPEILGKNQRIVIVPKPLNEPAASWESAVILFGQPNVDSELLEMEPDYVKIEPGDNIVKTIKEIFDA